MDDKEMNGNGKRPFTNSRQIRRSNDHQFLKMVIFTLVVVGSLIIALFYGPAAVLTALPFLLGGAALIAVPYWLLKGIEWLMTRYNGGS
ncbi:MAG: hypothetical protein H6667_04760 [Ardenticatenaceae bacterium]|nr:hypothetical protein [Ardenticatenaceae bacterium]